jgi:hypothetical protein
MATKRKDSDYVQIAKIRLREHVRRALLREAERNQRTLNAEIAARLEESLQRQERQALDTAVVQTLAGPDPVSAELVRQTVYEIQSKPHWYGSEEATELLRDSIDQVVRRLRANPSLFPGLRDKLADAGTSYVRLLKNKKVDE